MLVSVISRERHLVKARTGLEVCEFDRRISFCAHALGGDAMMIVPDATLDVRFATSPFVTGDPHIRFYAGVPLRAPTGEAVGTLCIIDTVPRRGLTVRVRCRQRTRWCASR